MSDDATEPRASTNRDRPRADLATVDLVTVDREWSAAERKFMMAFQQRDTATQAMVKVLRPPTEADVKSFRTWALVFASGGAISGFLLRMTDAGGSPLAVGAGFSFFCFVAAIYAWVYARRMQSVVVAYGDAKKAHEARRAEVEAAAVEAAAPKNSAAMKSSKKPRARS